MKHGAYVLSVDPGSIAEELELLPGDLIVSIDGQKITDYLDYKFLATNEHIVMEVLKGNGELFEFEIYNEDLEDLGINFENMLFDSPKSCQNKCIFCFIDQMPKGMRDSLYFKDDDSRLSFLYGNYVTLTNMKIEDIMRLIRYRISPVNISVHTTNPDLRVFMLKNKRANQILDHIQLLANYEIEMNMQIVLCKGINDGEELDRTIRDLAQFMPHAKSVSVVPVGLTKCRNGLYPLVPFEKEDCAAVVRQIKNLQERFLKEHGTRFVYASDEFFINAGMELPEESEYEDFPQIENGVGMIASMEAEFMRALAPDLKPQGTAKTVVATGEISYEFIKKLVNIVKMRYNMNNIEVVGIKNELFGGRVTVSGLLGGSDLIRALQDKQADRVLITESMLKADEDVFLDDYTLSETEKRLNMKIVPVKNDGEAFLKAVLGY
ncbi:DUF512 domain-containing protein [Congzhengia sp.]|uniref:DUF512 domain-containing protein n=1 Tax=Congzhengia sp. TaxID=2944168 RepID=UPI003076E37C